MKKLVRESLADKFTEKDPHLAGVPREFGEFEKKYKSQQQKISGNGEVFYKEGNLEIIKNPQSLKEFAKNVRGVIVFSGDLFIELHTGAIHNDIIKILQDKNIISKDVKKNWGNILPIEPNFITVQRNKDSNIIAIGESNRILYIKDNYEKYIKYYIPYLEKAKINCKNIEFSKKLIGTKIRNNVEDTHIINK